MPKPPALSNLRQIGGKGFQNGRRRTVYRANTEPVDASAYPPGLAAVIDLRRDDEIAEVPHALGDTAGYQNLPLFDPSSALESSAEAVEVEEQYIDWLERHRATIAAVFRRLAETDGDALVCCSAGKDRTGVVSGLLARLWGADLELVGVDYALTRDALAARFAAERSVTANLERTLIQQRCVPEVMIAVVEHIESRYGSIAGYLTSIGLTGNEIAAL